MNVLFKFKSEGKKFPRNSYGILINSKNQRIPYKIFGNRIELNSKTAGAL